MGRRTFPETMNGKKTNIRKIPARLFALLPLLLLVAAGPEIERLQIISVSRPPADHYERLTLVARKANGEIDTSYDKEVCLWTDGYWMRPSRVRFRPENKGVLNLKVMLELDELTRIEAYRPGSSLHAWSNPIWPRIPHTGKQEFYGVLPDNERNQAPPLYWGRIGACKGPGLDFCIGNSGTREGDFKPLLMNAVFKIVKGEKWIIVPRPDLPESEKQKIKKSVLEAENKKELYRSLRKFDESTTNILVRTKKAGRDKKKLLTSTGDRPPLSVLVLPAFSDDQTSVTDELKILSGLSGKSLPAVVAGPGPLLGVWSKDRSPEELWKGLRAGRCYSSGSGRTLVFYSAADGESGKATITIAGAGPRQTARLYEWDGHKAGLVETRKSDDFRLSFSYKPRQGRLYFLLVNGPDSLLLGGQTFAGPLPAFSLQNTSAQ